MKCVFPLMALIKATPSVPADHHHHTYTTPGFSQFEAQLIMMEAAAL